MTTLTNNPAGTDGVTITTANSGLDVVTIGANATAVYASNRYKFSTGASSVQCYGGLSTQVMAAWPGGMTTHYGGFYVIVDSLPAGTRIIAKYTNDAVSTDRLTFVMLATGAIRLRNSAAGTVATFTTLCSTATEYRVDFQADGANPGNYQMHLFLGDSTTALESITGGTGNFAGPIGAGFWGWQTSSASSPGIHIRGINMNDTGLPGPAGADATATDGAVTVRALSPGDSAGADSTAGDAPLVARTLTPADATAADSTATSAPQAAQALAPADVAAADSTAADLADVARLLATADGASVDVAATSTPSTARALASLDTTDVASGGVTATDTPATVRALASRDCVRAGSTVTRPATGTVTRPSTGLITRPDSGVVCRP